MYLHKFGIIFIFLLLGASALSQQKESVSPPSPTSVKVEAEGKSTELTGVFVEKEIKAFDYTPVLRDFWNQVSELRERKNFKELVGFAEKHISTYGDSSPEGYEARLARGIALSGLGFGSLAFYEFLDISKNQKGTNIGSFALLQVGKKIQNGDYDQSVLDTFMDSFTVQNLHPEILSFVSYFRGLIQLKFGYTEWAKKEFDLISENTYWHHLRLYWTAIAHVARNKVKSAEEIFKKLLSEDTLEANLKDRVEIQIARLDFEKGNFKDAFKLYSEERNFGLRQKGRILLEKAWTKFYMGDYGRALGILHALKAPLFKASQTYELFILEMLIFRQLCHFELVEFSGGVFLKRFGPSIKRIQKRKNLRSDKELFNLAVMDLEIQPKANLIAQMKIEWGELKKSKLLNKQAGKHFESIYKLASARLQMEVDQELGERLREAANQLLRAEEQIKFLQYTSQLDALKLSEVIGSNQYKAKKISKLKFEKMFWPVTSEYWFDEIEDYSMQISSLCLTETDQQQMNLEETFE